MFELILLLCDISVCVAGLDLDKVLAYLSTVSTNL